MALLLTPKLHETIFYVLLICPSLINKDNLIILEKAFNEMYSFCRMSWAESSCNLPLYGGYNVAIFNEFQTMIDNYVYPDMETSDYYSVLKDMIMDKARTSSASSAKIHSYAKFGMLIFSRDHRHSLSELLRRYILLLEDNPAIAGPQLLNILKIMMLTRSEVFETQAELMSIDWMVL